MNAKPSPAAWDRRGRKRSLAVARGWLLMAAMVASYALRASAQIHWTEFRRGSASTQPSVSTNQLLTPERAQKATERAREALLRGRYEEAQKQVTRALEICPNCAIALTLQGIMKIEGKNYAEAAQTFQQAINADPTLGAAYLGLGQAYNSLGRFKEALAPLARLDAILPGTWDAHCEIAVAHLGMGESEAALQDIRRAERVRRIDRQSRSALSYLRAIARLQMNDYRSAKSALEEVIEQDPKGEYAMRSRQLLEQLSARLTDSR
jgi:tetratricopeptide (TPR) repeat protein